MGDCEFQPLLDAFHDGELDVAARHRVERHLRGCPRCAAEMAALREIAERITLARDDEAGERALPAMHRAVDEAAAEERAALPLLRAVKLVGALAASVLVISGVWLLDLRLGTTPAGGDPAGQGEAPVALSADWERMAMTLRAAPKPGGGDGPLVPRYADAIDWMLRSLAPPGAPTEASRWAEPSSF